ncbi:hypothetical protein DRJ17_00275 [Candidatus Woesearchaeota archaeon]|nr:MAG: hypothetical protein DRJ17_00275 [Candidatus Woesearchaeota archaeon]
MEVKKVLKTAFALGTGLAMLGATVMGAAAYDLNDYPSPFITAGALNAWIVVGENALAVDTIGMTDIATSLQLQLAPGAELAPSVQVLGDSFRIDKSTNFLEINEDLQDVISTLTDDDLNALVGGTFRAKDGSYDYSEYLDIPTNSASVQYTVDDDDDDDKHASYLHYNINTAAYTYRLEFATSAESDVVTTSGEQLDDFQDKTITILGKPYTIIATDNKTTTNGLKIDLMGGAIQDVLEEGSSKTYTLDGTDYEVKVVIISDSGTGTDTVIMEINGERTDELSEGETYKLADDTEVGIRDILPNEAGELAGGDIVSFYLGAQKIVLEDTNYLTVGTGDQEVEVNDNDIDDTAVAITATYDGKIKLTKINVTYTPDDDLYIPEKGKLSDVVDDPEQLFTKMIDVEFKGLQTGTTEEIELDANGDDKYKLRFTNDAGYNIDIPYIYCTGSTMSSGDGTRDLVKTEYCDDGAKGAAITTCNRSMTFNIDINDYFVVDSGESSYLLQYKDQDADDNTLKFVVEGAPSGSDTIEITYSGIAGNASGSANAVIPLGGKDFMVWISADSNDQAIAVDLNDDQSIANLTTLVMDTKLGAQINLTLLPEAFFVRSEQLDNDSYDWINVTATCASSVLDFATPGYITSTSSTTTPQAYATGWIASKDADSDDKDGMTRYGIYAEIKDGGSNNPDELTLTYPDDQVEALVYVTSGEVTTVGGGTTAGSIVGTSIFDSDLAAKGGLAANNVIVVGGPCANSVAADLMGNPADCTEGFTPGRAMVKLFPSATGSKVAMLVAGYAGEDTRKAARVVADMTKLQALADGVMEVEVSGANIENPVVTVVQ